MAKVDKQHVEPVIRLGERDQGWRTTKSEPINSLSRHIENCWNKCNANGSDTDVKRLNGSLELQPRISDTLSFVDLRNNRAIKRDEFPFGSSFNHDAGSENTITRAVLVQEPAPASPDPDNSSSNLNSTTTTARNLKSQYGEMEHHTARSHRTTAKLLHQSRASSYTSQPSLPLPERRESSALYEIEWRKVQRLRIHIWSIRSMVHEKRGVLREKQYAKSNADDKYFRQVRLGEASKHCSTRDNVSEHGSISELLVECQRIRDEYGPLEDDCNILEDELSRQELELSKAEDILHVRLRDMIISLTGDTELGTGISHVLPEDQKLQNTQTSIRDAMADLGPYETDSEPEFTQQSHPLVARYLSVVGDMNILRERMELNIEEKSILDEENAVRERLGRSLNGDNEEWLRDYDNNQETLKSELELAEEETNKLRQECFSKGLIDEEGDPTDFATQVRFAFNEENFDPQSQTSEYVKFPALLPNPFEEEPGFYDNAPSPGEKSENAGDHINQWLLHRLRSSPLDVYLLASTFEKENGKIDDTWQVNVRAVWYKDGARKDISDYQIRSPPVSTAKKESNSWSRGLRRPRSEESISRSAGILLAKSRMEFESKSDGAETEVTWIWATHGSDIL